MKYFIFSLFVLTFVSCGLKNDNTEYKIVQTNFEDFHSITLLDKNNVEKIILNINDNGNLISYFIGDSRGFQSIANLEENSIAAYTISFGNDLSNENKGIDPKLIGKWEFYSIIRDGDTNRLPFEGYYNGGYEFLENGIKLYINGSIVGSETGAFTENNGIYYLNGSSMQNYLIDRDELIVLLGININSGEKARKVSKFSWE